MLVECVSECVCVMEALHQLTLIWYTGRFENIGSMFFSCRRIYFVFLCVWMLFLCSIAKLSILFHVRLYVVVVIRSSDRVMGVDVPSHSTAISLSRSLHIRCFKNLLFVRESRLTVRQTYSWIWPVYTYKFSQLSLSLCVYAWNVLHLVSFLFTLFGLRSPSSSYC